MSTLAKDSTVTLIMRGIMFLSGFITSIIVARSLGPAGRGSYSVFLLIISTTSLVTSLGMMLANVYFSASQPAKRGVLIGNSFLFAILLGGLGIIVVEGATLTLPVQNYLTENGVKVEWVRLLLLFLPLVLLNSYLPEIIRGSGRVVLYNLLDLSAVVVYLISVFILVFVLKTDVEGALVAWVLSTILPLPLTMALLVIHVAKPRQWGISWNILKQSLHYGLRIYPGDIIQFLNYRLDVLIVGIYSGPVQVGLYAIAVGLAEKLWEIPYSISVGLVPTIAANMNNAAATTERVSRIAVALVGAMCLLIAVVSYPLIYILYGEEYIHAAISLIFLLPGILALSLARLLASFYSGIGKPQISTYAAVVSLVFTIILDFLLIPRFGIVGASIASSVAYMVATVILLVGFVREVNSSFTRILLIRREDILLLRRFFIDTIRRRFLRQAKSGSAV